MKNSRRLLLGTFLTLLAVPVALTGYSRFSGLVTVTGAPAPLRTSAAELALLRDFSAIVLSGDIEVEIVQAADYAIEYEPVTDERGDFSARMEQGALFIEAFGNRTDAGTARVRIAMPELQRLNAEFLNALAIRNFDTAAMSLAITVMPGGLVIENNRIDMLTLDLQRVDNVTLRGNTIGTSQLLHFNTTITTD